MSLTLSISDGRKRKGSNPLIFYRGLYAKLAKRTGAAQLPVMLAPYAAARLVQGVSNILGESENITTAMKLHG